MPFATHRINTLATLGERLKRAREKAGISLRDVSKYTNIAAKYLEALEKDQYKSLPGAIYVKNFLRIYADFLGLDGQALLKIYEVKSGIYSQSLPIIFPHQTQRGMDVSPRFLRRVLFSIALVLALGYLILGIRGALSPPSLIVISPADDMIIQESLIKVVGWTDEGSSVMINDEVIEEFSAPGGIFEEKVLLRPGLNIIKISAKKSYSQERVILRRVMVIEGQQISGLK